MARSTAIMKNELRWEMGCINESSMTEWGPPCCPSGANRCTNGRLSQKETPPVLADDPPAHETSFALIHTHHHRLQSGFILLPDSPGRFPGTFTRYWNSFTIRPGACPCLSVLPLARFPQTGVCPTSVPRRSKSLCRFNFPLTWPERDPACIRSTFTADSIRRTHTSYFLHPPFHPCRRPCLEILLLPVPLLPFPSP